MTLTVLNPATGEPIAELEQAGVEEADEAVARALRVARAVDAGVLSVNANTSVRVQTPFGFKQSGFGRELGMHALDGYSEVKSVFVSTEG